MTIRKQDSSNLVDLLILFLISILNTNFFTHIFKLLRYVTSMHE